MIRLCLDRLSPCWRKTGVTCIFSERLERFHSH